MLSLKPAQFAKSQTGIQIKQHNRSQVRLPTAESYFDQLCLPLIVQNTAAPATLRQFFSDGPRKIRHRVLSCNPLTHGHPEDRRQQCNFLANRHGAARARGRSTLSVSAHLRFKSSVNKPGDHHDRDLAETFVTEIVTK